MASSNAQARGLVAVRICLGLFFLFEAMGKSSWLMSSAPLVRLLTEWLQTATPMNRWYLETICLPGAAVFARMVLFGEAATALALVLGVYTRPAALLAMLMVLNFHFAAGILFKYAYLTNGYGLPVLGGLLALAIGGASLPLSVKR